MIVSQADYERWQNTYAKGDRTAQKSAIAGANETGSQSSRQEFALSNQNEEFDRKSFAGTERPKSFLEEAFERLLLNRLGIDQDKMDELKEEIKNTETAIDALNDQKPHTSSQKKELSSLQDKLEKLEDALQELVKQANERTNKENALGQRRDEKSISQYQSISSLT